MKKLLLLLFGIVLALGVVGCNKGGSDLNLDTEEFIVAPSHLTISGTVLSWAAVDNADGYIVYANQEEADQVNNTSYDFSSLEGNRIIFQVKTKAPRGMEDSPLSASLAYVENKDQEIQQIKNTMISHSLNMSDGFAEELVNKGMLNSEVDSMLTEFETFKSGMSQVNDFESFIKNLNDMLSEVTNVEALVSALVKEYLPAYLMDEIANLESENQMYQNQIDQNPLWEEYYQGSIDQNQMIIDNYDSLLYQLQTNPNQVVLAITTTIDYFISIEQMMDENLVQTISSLIDVKDPTDLSASELSVVSDEMVNVLRETMPTQQDMFLIYQVYDMLLTLSGSSSTTFDTIDNFTGKMAVQSLYSLQAFIDFLDTLDETYYEDVVGYLNDEPTSDLALAETGILTIKYFDTFKQDNQALLDTISGVFTDNEKEIMFNDYVDALGGANSDVTFDFLSNINFQDLLDLETLSGDMFDKMLDAFIDHDGELLRSYVILTSYSGLYSMYDFKNYATGETFATSEEMQYSRMLDEITVMKEMVYVLQAGISEVSNDDVSLFAPFIANLVTGYLTDNGYATTEELSGVLDAFNTLVDNTGDQQLELVNNILNYLVDENVFSDYYDAMTSLEGQFNSDDSGYITVVFWAGIYEDFMTNSNLTLRDDIITEFFNQLSDSAVLSGMNLTQTDVDQIESTINNIFNYIDGNVGDIAGLDYTNLSSTDIMKINSFVDTLQGYLFDNQPR